MFGFFSLFVFWISFDYVLPYASFLLLGLLEDPGYIRTILGKILFDMLFDIFVFWHFVFGPGPGVGPGPMGPGRRRHDTTRPSLKGIEVRGE